VRYLTDGDVERLVSVADARAAVERAFLALGRGTAAVQARRRTTAEPPPGTPAGPAKLSTLGAVLLDEGVLGAKVYATVAGRFSFLVVLFAADDGRRLAVLESDALTRLRTGAASALAVERLARPASARLAVFGAGALADAHARALAAVLPLREIRVVGRREPPEAFARRTEEAIGVPVCATTDAAVALEDADVVVTATRSATPVFDGRLVRPGLHLCAAGTSLPDARELDEEALARCDRIVVEWKEQARMEAGGLVHAVAAGRRSWDEVAELADVLRGHAPGRNGPEEVTLYQSVGIGLEDVAVAAVAWARAEAEGIGHVLRSS
jgi:ornithine cyclodeaminase